MAYDNGINGLVVHKSNRATVRGNVVFGNGKVTKDIENRQDAGGIVINNSEDVIVEGNSATIDRADDVAFQCFGTCAFEDRGGNVACPRDAKVHNKFADVYVSSAISCPRRRLAAYVSTAPASPQYTWLRHPRRCCGSSGELTMDYICYETTEPCKLWQVERSSGVYISNDEDGYPTCEGCCGDDAGCKPGHCTCPPPSAAPSAAPSATPSSAPSTAPSGVPSTAPSGAPSEAPSAQQVAVGGPPPGDDGGLAPRGAECGAGTVHNTTSNECVATYSACMAACRNHRGSYAFTCSPSVVKDCDDEAS